MTPISLQNLVTEAVELDREIRELQEQLKRAKNTLVCVACEKERERERTATDGGGWSWTAPGKDGCIARVVAPAPKLRASLDPDVKAHAKILARFGDAAKTLFKKRLVFDLLDDFRERVATDFPPAQAEKLITACETESKPRVEFETTERPA